jgi:hypothetical protein
VHIVGTKEHMTGTGSTAGAVWLSAAAVAQSVCDGFDQHQKSSFLALKLSRADYR